MSTRNAFGVRYVFDGRSHDRLAQRSSGLRMLLGPSPPSNIRRSIAPSVVGTPAPHAAAPYRASGFVHCEGFRMPAHDDGATLSGAGVRKPSREETAEVWRSGASDAMGILALAVYRRGALRKRSMEWRVRSADRDSQKRRCATEVARQGSCPGRRGGEHGHCGSRAGEAEVQHWNVAANRV